MGKTNENGKPNPMDNENLRTDFDINNLKPRELIKKLEKLIKAKNELNNQTLRNGKEAEIFDLVEKILNKINSESALNDDQLNVDSKWASNQLTILKTLNTTVLNLTGLGNKRKALINEIANIIEKINEINKKIESTKKENSLLTKTSKGIKSLFKKKPVADQPPTEEEKPLPEEPIVIQNESPEKPITQENKINNLQDVKNEIITFTKQLLDNNNNEEVLNNFSKPLLEGLVKEFTNEKTEDVGVVRRALNNLNTVINSLKKNGKLVATNINTLKGILNTLEGPVIKPKPTQSNTPKKEEAQITEPEVAPIISDEEVVSEPQTTLEETVTEPLVISQETNEEVAAETEAPEEASKQENVKTEQGTSEPVSTETPAEQSVDAGPKETEINAPTEIKEEESENQKLIESAKSLDELIKIIKNNNISLTYSSGKTADTDYLVQLLEIIKTKKIDNDFLERFVTRTDGLRDKVQSLINQEKNQNSGSVESTPNNNNKVSGTPELKVEIDPVQAERIRKLQFESSLYNQEKLECDPLYKLLKEAGLNDKQIEEFNIEYIVIKKSTNEKGEAVGLTTRVKNYHDYLKEISNLSDEELSTTWVNGLNQVSSCGDVLAANFWPKEGSDNFLTGKPELKEKIFNLIQEIKAKKQLDEYQEKIDNNKLEVKLDETEKKFLETFKLLEIGSFGELFNNTKDFEVFQNLDQKNKEIILESVAREIRHSAKAYGLEKFNNEKGTQTSGNGFLKKLIKNVGFGFSEEKKRFDYEKEYLTNLDKKELGESVSILVGTLNMFNENDENTNKTKQEIIDEYVKFLEKYTSTSAFDKNSLATINGILNNKNESWAKAINDRLFRTFAGKGILVGTGLFLTGGLGLAAMPAMVIGGTIVGGVMGGIRATKKRREEAFLKRGQENEKASEAQGNESFSEIIKKGKFITYNKLIDNFTDKNQIEQVEAILKGNLIIWSDKNALKEKNDLIKIIVTKKFEALSEVSQNNVNEESVNKIRTWANRYGLKIDGKLGWNLAIGAGAGFIIGGAGRLLHEVFSPNKASEIVVTKKGSSSGIEQPTINPKLAETEQAIEGFAGKNKGFSFIEKDGEIIIKREGYEGTYKIENDQLVYREPGQPDKVLKKGDNLETGWQERKVSNENTSKTEGKLSKEDMDNQAKKAETDDASKPKSDQEKPSPKKPETPKNKAPKIPTPAPKVEETTPAPKVEETTPAPKVEETTPAPKVEETTPAPKVEETTPAPKVEETTPAPKVEETTPAPKVEETTPAPKVEETTPAPKVEETTPAPKVEETTPAPKVEETTPAPKVEETTPAPKVEETTPAPKVEETTPAPKVEETTPAPKVEETIKQPEIVTQTKTSLDEYFIDKSSEKYGFKINVDKNGNPEITRDGFDGYYTIDNKGIVYHGMPNSLDMLLPKGKNPLEESDWIPLKPGTVEPIQQEINSNINNSTNNNPESINSENSQLTREEPMGTGKTLNNDEILKNASTNNEPLASSKFFNPEITTGMSLEQLNKSEEIIKNIFGEKVKFELKNGNLEFNFVKSINETPEISHNLKVTSNGLAYKENSITDPMYRKIIFYKNLQKEQIINNELFKALEKDLKVDVKLSKMTINGEEPTGNNSDKYWTAIKNAKLSDIVKDIKK